MSGTPTHEHIDLAALNGDAFPPSYREFIFTAGWARSFGLWLIYPPVLPGYADGLHGRSRHLTERFRASYLDGKAEEFDWMIEPDGSWELADTLTVFGWSENGDVLLWDTSSRVEHGEHAVWESRGMNSLPLLRERAAGVSGSGSTDETASSDCEPLMPSRLDE